MSARTSAECFVFGNVLQETREHVARTRHAEAPTHGEQGKNSAA